nr:type II toxin-antitoxin system RelE/ParE family toxin [Methylococcus geothermalis]
MSIYKTRWFDRWAEKQGIDTQSLCMAVREMAGGLYEADLGGGLFKNTHRPAGTRQERAVLHTGCDQQREPLDFRVRFSKKRAERYRQRRGTSFEEALLAPIVSHTAQDRASLKGK